MQSIRLCAPLCAPSMIDHLQYLSYDHQVIDTLNWKVLVHGSLGCDGVIGYFNDSALDIIDVIPYCAEFSIARHFSGGQVE